MRFSLSEEVNMTYYWNGVDLYSYTPISNYTFSIDFDKISFISSGSISPTIGITVKNEHSHLTNGIVSHNTGRTNSSKPNLQNIPK